MSIQAPQGILNIPNAILRVGKLSVDEVVGADTILNTVARNTILLVDGEEYTENKNWALKLPNAWAGEFDIKTTGAGNYAEFNFYNEGASSNAQGYNLTFNDTAVELRYDGGSPAIATGVLPSTVVNTYRKVRLMFERTILSVTVDGTLIFTHDDTGGPRPRVYSTTAGGFLNFFTDGGALKNLKIVNEKWISDGTSNIAYVGGGEVAVGKALAFNRVSNVSQIKVDTNVVTEYTGPHDRPLRKYPEVALTANDNSSTSGYVASASTQNSSNPAYHMFDGIISTRWLTQGTIDSYNSNAPYEYVGSNSSNIVDISGTSHNGIWLKLELPKVIKLDYTIIRDNTDPANRTPGKITFLGSTNGTDWTFLKEFSGMSDTSSVETYQINDTNYYNYFAFVVKNLSDADQYLDLGEWELYGHEEGSGSLDTTLKSVYNVPATTGTQLEVYYDGKDLADGAVTAVTDLSGNGVTGAGSGDLVVSNGAFTFDGTGDEISATYPSVAGDNIITMSAWILATGTGSGGSVATPLYLGNSYGSNSIGIDIYENGNIFWYIPGSSYILFNSPKVPLTVKNQWFHVTGTYQTINSVIEMKFYVNGEDVSSYGTFVSNGSLSLVGNDTLHIGKRAGVTTANWNGSIANFRLYSKALNAGQVQELYDYQKDYFLGSKSQVTLYKGHLGVGVTEPSGQLELAGDERIQEYPPGPMDGYETLIPGHGVFCASASSYFGTYYPWKAFDRNTTDTASEQSVWHTTADFTNATPGIYNAGASLGGYTGAWLKLKLPYSIKPSKVSIHPRTYNGAPPVADYDQNPKDFLILGSKDDNTWDVLSTQAGVVFGTTWKDFILSPGNNSYSYFAISCTKVKHGSYFAIADMKYFGTPGPTTLDKGSLSLTRSLDVPRISRYDVDTETPRPEKLVVDFDTTVNSSPTDISGRGNHGTFGGSAYYSAADKAFVFDGVDDYIKLDTGLTGNVVHSISMWIKAKADLATGNVDVVFYWGANGSGSHRVEVLIEDDKINYNFATNDYEVTFPANTLVDDRWYHLVFTYNGVGGASGREIYIDGVKQTGSHIGSTDVLALANSDLYLASNFSPGNTYHFGGQISNFKLYSVALEPSEVKKLYNLGRTGRSMVISDTAVGIGKVPEAQLDVRGSARFTGSSVVGGSSYVGGLPSSSFDYLNPSLHLNSLPKNMLRLQVKDNGDAPSLDDFPNIYTGSIMPGGGGSLLDPPANNYYDITRDPYDRSCIVFRCRGTGSSLCGGWHRLNVPASYRRSYMSVVFVKRAGTASSGAAFYHGCSTKNTANFSGVKDSNPYFHNIGYSSLPNGVWCVSIGFVHFKGATSGYNTGKAGMYRLDTMAKIDTGTEFTFYDEYDEQTQRAFLYNNTLSGGYLDFWNPGWFDTQTIFPETNILNVFTRDLTETSDDRLKSDERFIRGALDSIMKLKPQLYKKHLALDSLDETVQEESGLMAQDIYYDTPELRHIVKPGEDYGAIKSIVPIQSDDPNADPDYTEWGKNPAKVDYRGLIPYTIKAIQELNTEMTRSKFRIVGVPYSRLMDYTGLCVRSVTPDEVELTTLSNDKSVVGVLSTTQNINEYEDSRVLVDIVGKGGIWVIDTNNLKKGDYLTTSNIVSGYAQVQTDDLVHSYTVAKALQDVNFTEVQKPVRIIKQELSNVSIWVKTTHRVVMKDVYDKLDENERCIITRALPSLDDENDETIDTYNEIVRYESQVKIPGYIPEVRQELVNVLDEHGQLQWEDHPTETEKAYKIRYLDANGAETDEANHVYKAAFVGCTYHCG